MSTKSTIAHGDDYHLYDELMDGGLYLEVKNARDASIQVVEGRTVVKIRLPKALIERLKLDNQQLVEPSKMFEDESVTNLISNGKK